MNLRRKGETPMNERTEGVISLLAALLVLLNAMLEPRVSLGLAVAFLVILAGYKLIQSSRRSA
jgi:uncharacterized membrane protein YwaF